MNGKKYYLHEIFFSVNGEGLQSGRPMVFIRLSGCNLRCNWCDTKGSWVQKEKKSSDEIIKKVREYRTDWVCITGGEPLLQDLDPLISQLDRKISLETNGTIYKDLIKKADFVSADIKPPSSGMQIDLAVLQKILDSMKDGELKAVITDKDDYLFVKNVLKEIDPEVPLVLQPNYYELSYNELFSLYREDPIDHDVRIMMQLHKAGGIQ
ncbi:MAG: 7-carboxy-7-deazaguanine synthase QueE [Euryarchaeota archaeon]|nr:7-carboxy-7-deazaguanine synthase QueE [Euryarchaeota archaeon]